MEMTTQRRGVPPPKRPFEISGLAIEFLFMHAVQDPAIWHLCRTELQPDMLFKPSEMAHRHIWRRIIEYYDEHARMPGYEALSMQALLDIENDPLARADPETGGKILENAAAALSFMYDTKINPPESLEPWAAKEVLRQILTDRGPEEELRRAVTYAVGQRIVNLPELVEKAQRRIVDIAALGRAEEERTTLPTTWATVAKPKWPTGVEFVDNIMGGGSAPGDCNVIIGPSGGGKTTLAMQIACSTARLQSQLARRGVDGKPGLVVFVSYEDDREMLQIRAASYSARVQKDRLRFLKDDADLSRTGRLEDYEKALYGNGGNSAEMLGEIERLDEVRPWIDKYLVLVDYHDPIKGGRGHVTEVAQKLTAVQQDRGMPIRMVILDWGGNLVANYLQATEGRIDSGGMSLQLQNLINRAKQELASPFNCTVWVPHQLKGALNDRPPAKLPHHSEAQWCSSFSDHAWYAFVLGSKDKEHNVCQFGATKTRHGETPAPVILKIDGALCAMRDVSQHFAVDAITRRLAPITDVSKFHANISGRRQQGVSPDR